MTSTANAFIAPADPETKSASAPTPSAPERARQALEPLVSATHSAAARVSARPYAAVGAASVLGLLAGQGGPRRALGAVASLSLKLGLTALLGAVTAQQVAQADTSEA